MKLKICAVCGKNFRGRTSARYCSVECKAIGVKEIKINGMPMRQAKCPECGIEFETNNSRKIYCSRTCASKNAMRNYYERMREEKRLAGKIPITIDPDAEDDIGACKYCGAEMPGNKKGEFCKVACQMAYDRELQEMKRQREVKRKEQEKKKKEVPRTVCKRAKDCFYARPLSGLSKSSKTYYCNYCEIVGHIRGGYPDECTHFKTGRKNNVTSESD